MKQLFSFVLCLIILIPSFALSQSIDANGVGVDGTTKSFKAYKNASLNKYYLVDVSKPMFDATRLVPSDTGQIIVLDAKNALFPQPKNFTLVESNSTTFTDPIAIESLYHFEKAYDFFNQNFGVRRYNNQKSSVSSSFIFIKNHHLL
jgi:Zn-dependent metalloprotease